VEVQHATVCFAVNAL